MSNNSKYLHATSEVIVTAYRLVCLQLCTLYNVHIEDSGIWNLKEPGVTKWEGSNPTFSLTNELKGSVNDTGSGTGIIHTDSN